ncbi:MAG: hypothetical protein NUV56_03595 [Candidatus Uhrbacteria bacterium]|nr:hypothetical protein [Candidatus Uhrbacteria bacterium]
MQEPTLRDVMGAIEVLTKTTNLIQQDVSDLKQDIIDMGEAVQGFATHVDERFDCMEAKMATKDYVDRRIIEVEDRILPTVRAALKAL